MKIMIDELKRGEEAKIVGFMPGEKGYRHKLLAMGLTPGTTFVLSRIAPLGDPIEIYVRGYALSLRKREMSILSLEKTEP